MPQRPRQDFQKANEVAVRRKMIPMAMREDRNAIGSPNHPDTIAEDDFGRDLADFISGTILLSTVSNTYGGFLISSLTSRYLL